MNNIAQNSITSESEKEIKINMTFGQALEITQQTYNYFNKLKYERELNELCIKRKKIPEKWLDEEIEKLRKKITEIEMIDKKIIKPFVLFDDYYDEKSNFSGLTYIYDDEKTNTVNVAIACRGSVKFSLCTEEGKKDWWHNNWGMLRKPNTDSDNFAKNHAINILAKIQDQYQYSDKQINVITLGHSKGGREAQKQMLAIKNNNEYSNINIYCLTFNSAFCSKEDSTEDNKKNYGRYHTNLYVYNRPNLGIDPTYITKPLLAIVLFIIIVTLLFGFSVYCLLGLKVLLTILVLTVVFNFSIYNIKRLWLSKGVIIIMLLLAHVLTMIIGLISMFNTNKIELILHDNFIYLIYAILIWFCFIGASLILIKRFSKLGENCGENLDYLVEDADILNSHDLKSFFQGQLFEDVQSLNLNEALEKLKKLANQKDKKKS